MIMFACLVKHLKLIVGAGVSLNYQIVYFIPH